MSDVDIGELSALARRAAGAAADLIWRMRAESVDIAATKSSATDVVTRADLASEALLREQLLGARPDDGFIGEEGEDVASTSGVTWVVDPIDGTVNYLYGIPFYGVSVAGLFDGEAVVGVVRAPALDREYRATRGGGAFRNGVALHAAPMPSLDLALVATGFGYEMRVRESQAAATALLLPHVRDIRRMGSCALDICSVAEGTVDAYVESGPRLWDHAAAALIAHEAGARFAIEPSRSGDDRDVLLCAPHSGFVEFRTLTRTCGF